MTGRKSKAKENDEQYLRRVGLTDTIATDSPRGVLPGGFVWRVGRE